MRVQFARAVSFTVVSSISMIQTCKLMDPSFDTLKSLGNEQHRLERMARLQEPHIKDISAFVETIRKETNHGDNVPYFDPEDGGIYAECLFLLEAPGPRAVDSGFVSRNNPDCTAANWLDLNEKAGIDRKKTLMWNIVPWYLGENGRIRPAKKADIDAGWKWLLRLLDLLPNLRMVVLVGRKAQRVNKEGRKPYLKDHQPELIVMECFHPSPSFINRKPENYDRVLAALQEVAGALR